MSKTLFVKTNTQKAWLEKLYSYEESFKSYSSEIDEKSRFPKENIKALVESGYTKVTLPKEYGGEGHNVTDMVLLQETIASFDGDTALSIGWHQSVVGELYQYKLWEEHQLKEFAEKVTSGALVNRAASEAQTGSPTRGGRPGTHAIKKTGGWTITGQKTFTTMSPALTHFLVSAWVEEKNGLGFFLVERGSKGMSIKENWNVISMRGTESHDLILEDVEVKDQDFVELIKLPRGSKLNGWLLHIPACYLGIAQAARDYAVNYSTEYSPNSIKGMISELPNVQNLIGQMDLELMKARHFLYSVAAMYDDESRRQLLTNELSAAKHIVTNSSLEIVDKAMRLVGAKSLQLSNPLQRYYRDVRAGLHNPPMDDMTISKLAQSAIEEFKK